MSVPRKPGFFERRSLVTWAVVLLVGLGVYWQVSHTLELWGAYPGGIVAAVVVWILYGAVLLWLIVKAQLFEHRPLSAAVAAVLWGLFVAGGVVAVAGQDLQSITDKLLGFELSREWGPAFRAPFIEETMKYLGVVALALIPRVRLTRVIDGVFYGMLSGLGFTVSENIFFSNEAIAFGGGEGVAAHIGETFASRGVLALPFGHVVFTAIAGAGVGYVMSRRGRPVVGRIAVAVGLFATAFALHGFQNSPLLEGQGGGLFIKGLPALLVFLLVLRWARRAYIRDLRAIAAELPELTDADMDVLVSRRRRRKAAKAAANTRESRAVQRAQIDVLVAADIYGVQSPETARAASQLAPVGAGENN